MKAWLIGLFFIAVLVGVSLFLTFNVRMQHSITISIENDTQILLLIKGHEPETTFESIQDTPYGDNIKILKVNTHHIWGGTRGLNEQLSSWLSSLNITSYPEFPIKYTGE